MLGLSLNFEIWIKDAGWPRLGGTHRIMITLRFRVRHGREIRRDQNRRIFKGIPPEGCSQQKASILKWLF
jgi:hypothetical protein